MVKLVELIESEGIAIVMNTITEYFNDNSVDEYNRDDRKEMFQEWLIEHGQMLPERTIEILMKNANKGVVNRAVRKYFEDGEDYETDEILDGNECTIITRWFEQAKADEIVTYIEETDRRDTIQNQLIGGEEYSVEALIDDIGIDAAIEQFNELFRKKFSSEAVKDILGRW